MTDELRRLWSLRGLDERRAVVRQDLDRLPGQRRELEERVAGERARLEALKARVTEIQRLRRQRELEIEAASEQERRFQSQLYAVKKNEEYTALLHEIDAVRSKRSDMETAVLLQLDEEERMQEERPGIEHALEEAVGDAGTAGARLDAEERELQERLAQVERERAAELEGLPAATRQRYERIHGSRGGRAVVPIAKGACGGCFRTQPPHVLQEARRGDRVLSCDGCGRLILWPPETS